MILLIVLVSFFLEILGLRCVDIRVVDVFCVSLKLFIFILLMR